MIEVEISVANKKHESFVYATWLHSFKYNSYFCKRIKTSTFFKSHHDVINNLLERKTINILVATPSGDREVVFGYLVYERGPIDTVHYIYIKKNFRGFKIANKLISEAKIDLTSLCNFSHWSFDADWIIQKFPMLVYDPYLMFKEKIWQDQVDPNKIP